MKRRARIARQRKNGDRRDAPLLYPDGFLHVGGLREHVQVLREIVLIPLICSDVYEMFHIQPPRGVLLHGPPGTGKTLVAGALPGECKRRAAGEVQFYAHKGADVLNKYIGESEKRLTAVFEKAANNTPAIIFFDELDGLAPIRSGHSDQIHTSIVATLLALMDGLDRKTGVVVIGATNRVDALDPALRRPGRFDRELYFPLPSLRDRIEILKVHVQSWCNPPSDGIINELAEGTSGCSGADLKALCSDAVVCCLKRTHPLIQEHTTKKLQIKKSALMVTQQDFLGAYASLRPRWRRPQMNPGTALPCRLQPLLGIPLDISVQSVHMRCPHFVQNNYTYSLHPDRRHLRSVLFCGERGQGQDERLAPAFLSRLAHLPSHVLDIAGMFGTTNVSIETACVQIIEKARAAAPSTLYVTNLEFWWTVVEEAARLVFTQMLLQLDPNLPLLIVAVCTGPLPEVLASLFDPLENIVIDVPYPSEENRAQFFSPLFYGMALLPPDAFHGAEADLSDSCNYSSACMRNTASRFGEDRNWGDNNGCLIKKELFCAINKFAVKQEPVDTLEQCNSFNELILPENTKILDQAPSIKIDEQACNKLSKSSSIDFGKSEPSTSAENSKLNRVSHKSKKRFKASTKSRGRTRNSPTNEMLKSILKKTPGQPSQPNLFKGKYKVPIILENKSTQTKLGVITPDTCRTIRMQSPNPWHFQGNCKTEAKEAASLHLNLKKVRSNDRPKLTKKAVTNVFKSDSELNVECIKAESRILKRRLEEKKKLKVKQGKVNDQNAPTLPNVEERAEKVMSECSDGGDFKDFRKFDINDSSEALDRIIIDKEKLQQLFEKTISVTRNFPVMYLDKMYQLLDTVMGHYAPKWDRRGLIPDIEMVLAEFEARPTELPRRSCSSLIN